MELVDALASTASARSQMAFQERMSNTAHQREVADLKAAGLNPVLSAGGAGATTPNGAEGDYSAVLGLLSQSMQTSAKAVSSMGKSLEDVIKGGLVNAQNAASSAANLKDIFSNFGSADNAYADVADMIFKDYDDNERIRLPFVGSVKVEDLKRKIGWFVANGLGNTVLKNYNGEGVLNSALHMAYDAATPSGLGNLYSRTSARRNSKERKK